MRKIFLLIAASIVLISCDKGYTVTGTIKGADGKKVKIVKQMTLGAPSPEDTTTVRNGKFVLEGKIEEPTLYDLYVDGLGKTMIVLEKGDISIDVNNESMILSKISGTYNNEQLTELQQNEYKLRKKLIDYMESNKPVWQRASATKDTATMRRLRVESMKLNEETMPGIIEYRKNYVAAHPQSFVSALLIRAAMEDPNLDVAALQKQFDNLAPELKKSGIGKEIEDKFESLKTVEVGKRAPNFKAKDLNGKEVSLNGSLNRIVIIDFWASWCPQCRKENPNLVALYNEFHEKGLNIVSVSLDKKHDAWKVGVEKDGLIWTNVSNLKGWEDPIAARYGVEALPGTFILNQYGVVVAKNLHGEGLRKQIVKMLESKPLTLNKPTAKK